MSEETKNSDNKPNTDEERKQQFEKMRERFSNKKPNGPGGGPPKNSFNFYWIYAIVVIGLLAFTMLGSGFNAERLEIIDQAKFDTYLSKGWVTKVIIVNDAGAEVYLQKDSLNKHFVDSKTSKPVFKKEYNQELADDEIMKALAEEAFGEGIEEDIEESTIPI